DMSNVTSMRSMFRGCNSLLSIDLSDMNIPNVIDMGNLFSECSSLTSIDVSVLDTSNVEYMYNLFYKCTLLETITLGGLFDSSNAISTEYMFYECTSLTSIDMSQIDTSSSENVSGMFAYLDAMTTIDVSSMDVSKVKYMYDIFAGSSFVTIDLSTFNTPLLEDMSGMFNYSELLENIIFSSSLDTSNVEYMSYAFEGCVSLVSMDLSDFDFSSVLDLGSLFEDCILLECITNIDSRNATDRDDMFDGCTALINPIDLEVIDIEGSGGDDYVNGNACP
ncbi:MAG: BspA family leucine-rich repeat surface protein, partial [Deltaproteobacteria bacterium]